MAFTFYALLLVQLIVFVQSSPTSLPVSQDTNLTTFQVHPADFDYRLRFRFGCTIFRFAPSGQTDYVNCIFDQHALRRTLANICNGTWPQHDDEFNETSKSELFFFDGPTSLRDFYDQFSKSGKPIGSTLLYWIRGLLADPEIKDHEVNLARFRELAESIANQTVVSSEVLQHFNITSNSPFPLKGRACEYNFAEMALDFRLTEDPSIYLFYATYAEHYLQEAVNHLQAFWVGLQEFWIANEVLIRRYWVLFPLGLGVLLVGLIACVLLHKKPKLERELQIKEAPIELVDKSKACCEPVKWQRTRLSTSSV